jgi:hypothetical protein
VKILLSVIAIMINFSSTEKDSLFRIELNTKLIYLEKYLLENNSFEEKLKIVKNIEKELIDLNNTAENKSTSVNDYVIYIQLISTFKRVNLNELSQHNCKVALDNIDLAYDPTSSIARLPLYVLRIKQIIKMLCYPNIDSKYPLSDKFIRNYDS